MSKDFDLAAYVQLKADLEQWRQREARTAGAEEQVLFRLQEEFGCISLVAAKALLAKLCKQEERQEVEAAALLKTYQNEWGNKLEDRT